MERKRLTVNLAVVEVFAILCSICLIVFRFKNEFICTTPVGPYSNN